MNKTIYYFLGLLTGILIWVLFHYIDTKKLKSLIPSPVKKEVVTVVEKDTVFVEKPQPKKNLYPTNTPENSKIENDTELEQENNEISIYETEFSFDGNEPDEVFAAQLLHTKTVKVKLLAQDNQEGKLPDGAFQSFEIQQWSTPIKNKITYYRSQNMIKIKGMVLNQVGVVFANGIYYLEVENRYYSIPETINFDKLVLINLPK